MGRFTLIAMLAVMLTACGASPRRGYYEATGPDTSGPAIDPRALLDQMDQELRKQGYGPAGPAVHGSLDPNGILAYAVDANPQLCYTFAVIGKRGQDINLVVIDPFGRTIGYDVRPDEHPWATVCPGVLGRVYARVQMVQGSGDYYYAVYQGPQQARPDLAAFFGNAQTGEQTAELDNSTNLRIQALDQSLGVEGLRRADPPKGIQLRERQERQYALNLQQGACYAFGALGGEGSQDTDVLLTDGAGTQLARDTVVAPDALLRFCAQQTGAYTLTVRMNAGSGPLFTVAYTKVATQGEATATPAPQPIIANTSTSGAGLEENFRVLDADMRARGYVVYGEPHRGELAEGAARSFELPLEGDKCYAILGVGDNGIRNLDLRVYDRDNHVVDKDLESNARPTVRVCARSSGNHRMEVKVSSGEGKFVYSAYKWPRGTKGPFGLKGLVYVRLAEVTSLLNVEGFTPDPDYALGRGSLKREGASQSHDIELQGGQCYSILVVGDIGLNDIDITLSSPTKVPLASDGNRNAFPSVRQCASEKGKYSIAIKSASGAGKYVYQVFKQGSGN